MKLIDETQVAGLIPDNATMAIGGFTAYGCPEDLVRCIQEGYWETRHPRNLTIICVGTGDTTNANRGLNRLGAAGLLGMLYTPHVAHCPILARMAAENVIPAFMPPLGVVAHLMRAIGGGQSGVLTTVGLHTLADPRLDGCAVNDKARECERKVVELVHIGGQEQLFYPAFPVDVTLIRATYADEDGNLSFDNEAELGMEIEMVKAAHNSGGRVIAQVEKIVERGSILPKNALVPAVMVDYVMVSRPEYHQQSFAGPGFRPEISGQIRVPTSEIPPMPLNFRKVVARRTVMELRPGTMINMGIGMPSYVGEVANEERIPGLTIAMESGPIGGVPVSGKGFGASINAGSIITMSDAFDFSDGGGLDLTCLGAAEIDAQGNVNVSSFPGRCVGPGGFINLTQRTKNVCFLFSFTVGARDIRVGDGKLDIRIDGRPNKLIPKVRQITFAAEYAREHGQHILYISERAVFTLCEDGLELIEIAPGVDLQRDILDKMAFTPRISPNLRLMDERIFREGPMGVLAEIQAAAEAEKAAGLGRRR